MCVCVCLQRVLQQRVAESIFPAQLTVGLVCVLAGLACCKPTTSSDACVRAYMRACMLVHVRACVCACRACRACVRSQAQLSALETEGLKSDLQQLRDEIKGISGG